MAAVLAAELDVALAHIVALIIECPTRERTGSPPAPLDQFGRLRLQIRLIEVCARRDDA